MLNVLKGLCTVVLAVTADGELSPSWKVTVMAEHAPASRGSVALNTIFGLIFSVEAAEVLLA